MHQILVRHTRDAAGWKTAQALSYFLGSGFLQLQTVASAQGLLG